MRCVTPSSSSRRAARHARAARRLRRIAELLKEIVDFDDIEIRLVDQATNELYRCYASDEDVSRCRVWRSSIDQGVSGWVVRHDEAQLVNDMLNDSRGALVPATVWCRGLDHRAAHGGRRRHRGLALDGWSSTFSAPELEPVTLFANLAAIAIQNARQYEEAEEASVKLQEQLALSHELLERQQRGALVARAEGSAQQHIADTLKQIVDYDSMDIRLVDAEHRQSGGGLRYATRSTSRDLRLRDLDGRRRQRWSCATDEAQLVNDMAPRSARRLHPLGPGRGSRGLLVPRLCVGDEVIGVMTMDRLGGRTFEQHELEPARLFANMAAIAIHNARQYDRLERTSGRLDGLRPAACADGPEHHAAQLARPARGVRPIRPCSRTSSTTTPWIIRLLDEETRELVCIYSRDTNAEQVEQFRVSIDDGVSGWVVRHDEAQLVEDRHDQGRAHCADPGHAEEGAAGQHHRAAQRPRQGDWRPVPRPHGRPRLRSQELEPAQLCANLAAIAIQNARTYEEMERQAISDGLTGIHNYRHFHESLKAEVSRAGRYGEHFCLLMMDLDHFKAVNDTIGHQRSRRRRAARRLRRAAQLLARVGLRGAVRRRGVRHDPAANVARGGQDTGRAHPHLSVGA